MDGVSDGIYGSLSEALRHLKEKNVSQFVIFTEKLM